MESAKIIAGLTRLVGDVGQAEELAQDALVAALKQWPDEGVPANPGAWLTAAAKRRAIDLLRHRTMRERHHEHLARDADDRDDQEEALAEALDDDLGDHVLSLVFTACHPIISAEARAALALRLLGGLTTGEIGRAFLTPESTIAQRIVRAKKTLAEAKVPFEVPRGEALAERLASVLEVIYLVFNEGYSATAGEDLIRPALCEEAMRLGRILAAAMPREKEVHGLLALMEIQASRAKARTDEAGAPILLLDQNRALWDRLLINRGLAAIESAKALGGYAGPYLVQAMIAACHARAVVPGDTDWTQITALYGALHSLNPSPVIALNHAVAYGMANGPERALPLVEALAAELEGYYLLESVRGDLLFKLGRLAEARIAFEVAAALTQNERERAFLLGRAAACS